MKLTPARYFLTTLLLAATGAWLGYQRATKPVPPTAPPPATILSRPAAPVAATPATTAGVEDLVRLYLTACNDDPALAGALRQQLLAASPPLLQRTWEELAARHPDLDADDIRSVLNTLRHILCERDPKGFIPWLVETCPRGQLTNQLWTMLESWSARDPSAAWACIMAETIPPSVREGLTNAVTTIGHDFAQSDPAAAFAAFLALPADHWLPDYAAEILCREAATPGRRMSMLEQLVRQPPGRLRPRD